MILLLIVGSISVGHHAVVHLWNVLVDWSNLGSWDLVLLHLGLGVLLWVHRHSLVVSERLNNVKSGEAELGEVIADRPGEVVVGVDRSILDLKKLLDSLSIRGNLALEDNE